MALDVSLVGIFWITLVVRQGEVHKIVVLGGGTVDFLLEAFHERGKQATQLQNYEPSVPLASSPLFSSGNQAWRMI